MAQITTTQMTAAKFLELPETLTPTQLIGGEVIVSPAPEIPHQDVVLNSARCAVDGEKWTVQTLGEQ